MEKSERNNAGVRLQRKGLPFGKVLRAGNFMYMKHVVSLDRKRLRELRGKVPFIPKGAGNVTGVSFIRVSTVSGSWSLDISCVYQIYNAIDQAPFEVSKDGEASFKGSALGIMSLLADRLYADTTLVGDAEYTRQKMEALKDFLDRRTARKGARESAEEKKKDDEILAEEESRMRTEDTIRGLGEEILKADEKERKKE